ncbi:hypothetical protein FGO68_gene11483 [Halteria grandinella]|uniref:Uncharacterized protein n=1 Tax=Halteria grandinella TaxID=5974 RepID=A0A8J8PA61_HALGN|nr:hypothetical protein FGO68_gene11483 [Halteria grandinella]
MAQLWGMLNSLALLTMLSLISVNIPGIARYISRSLVAFSQLDIFPTSVFLQESLGLKFTVIGENSEDPDNDPLTSELADLGFGSRSTSINMGSTLVYLVGIGLAFAALGLFQIFSWRIPAIKSFYQKIHSLIVWGAVLRFLQQQYLTLYLSSLIKLYSLTLNSPGDIFDIVLTVPIFIVCSIYPIWSIVHVIRNFNKPNIETTQNLIENLKIKSLAQALCTTLETMKQPQSISSQYYTKPTFYSLSPISLILKTICLFSMKVLLLCTFSQWSH